MTSPSNNIGSWASQELSFLIPVRWLERDGQGYRLRGLGAVPVLTYTDNHTAMISASEVLGIPAVKGNFVSPPDPWMADPAQEQQHAHLIVSAEVLPTMQLGQKIQERVLVELHRGEIFDEQEPGRWHEAAAQWGPILRADLERKKAAKARHREHIRGARALSMELLANGVQWNLFTLKQFRDAIDQDTACYQSLVRCPRRIDHLQDVREIEEPIHVRIHEYPSQPIVELLGLVATQSVDRTGGVLYHLKPVRPFWVKLHWTQELAHGICYRSGDTAWRMAQPVDGYFSGEARRQLAIGKSVEDCIDDAAPVGLKELLHGWRAAWSDRLTLAEATAAVEAVDPQLVIETILSREWENRGRDSRWQHRRSDLERGLTEHLAAVPEQERGRAEIDYFEQALLACRAQRYQPPVLKVVEEKLRFLAVLAESCAQLDGALVSPSPTDAARRIAQAVERIGAARIVYPTDAARWRELRVRLDQLLPPGPTTRRSQRAPEYARAVATLVRTERQRQREAVLDKLAKVAQKPDYCLWRKSLGPERDRLLPLTESWDHSWYVGSLASSSRHSSDSR